MNTFFGLAFWHCSASLAQSAHLARRYRHCSFPSHCMCHELDKSCPCPPDFLPATHHAAKWMLRSQQRVCSSCDCIAHISAKLCRWSKKKYISLTTAFDVFCSLCPSFTMFFVSFATLFASFACFSSVFWVIERILWILTSVWIIRRINLRIFKVIYAIFRPPAWMENSL